MPSQECIMNRWIQFQDEDPRSVRQEEVWPLVVVARLDPDRRGPRYPLAAIETHSHYGSLGILTACANTLRIFSDPLNHLAIQSDLSLAYEIYNKPRPWPEDVARWIEFPGYLVPPFIANCLSVGTTRNEDATSGWRWNLPLETVFGNFADAYRIPPDYLAVIDVTDPAKVRYAFGYGDHLAGYYQNRSTYRHEPPKPLSAVEFLARRRSCRLHNGSREAEPVSPVELEQALEITCRWKVMEVETLDFRRPHNPSPTAVDSPQSLHHHAFMTLVRGAAEMESLDLSIFDHVRAIPNFQEDLRRVLLRFCADLGDHQAIAQLIALALDGKGQLDLTPFKNLSPDSISTILGNQSPDIPITSISLCIDTLQCTPLELLQTLARFPTIQNLYLSQLPDPKHQPSTKFFIEMLKMPSLLPKGQILVAGLLTETLWRSRVFGPLPAPSYQIPFDIFPVQYMFVRHQTYGPDQEHFWPNYLSISDLFLRPERFAAGFLRYILRSVQPGSVAVEASEKLFDFCSAPPTLNHIMDEHRYQISQIPLENTAIPLRPRTSRRRENVGDCWPLVRAIEPGSWTVLVSLHHNHITRDLENLSSTRPHHATNWARYAFVRTKSRVDVTRPPVRLPPPEEVEVVSLKEFLRITSPDTNPAIIDIRLEELEENAALPRQQPLPDGVRRLSVMDRDEALGILKDFLNNVEMVKKNLWAFMKENDGECHPPTKFPENRFLLLTQSGFLGANPWYPDLLEECNGQLYGSMVHGPDDIFVDSVNAQLSLQWWESDPEEDDDGENAE
ncbi:hypothetical protein QBC40DRAFT_296331 [Triangularia verruculosa]|uniref:Uncharacterized protein n=1 Tax=Triangularia verruculosa TaxID=2587418 RepID=A0AAN6XHE4_9PEZI|nr:hypothetical protein QBC40DRAFT_296331 [Triangularia verruculosa]